MTEVRTRSTALALFMLSEGVLEGVTYPFCLDFDAGVENDDILQHSGTHKMRGGFYSMPTLVASIYCSSCSGVLTTYE